MPHSASFADDLACQEMVAAAVPAAPETTSPLAFVWHQLTHTAARVWPWMLRALQLPLVQSKARRLRVSESVSLGDKRFLSIVQVDGVEYLVGVGSAQITLLAPLAGHTAPTSSFEELAKEAWRKDGSA